MKFQSKLLSLSILTVTLLGGMTLSATSKEDGRGKAKNTFLADQIKSVKQKLSDFPTDNNENCSCARSNLEGALSLLKSFESNVSKEKASKREKHKNGPQREKKRHNTTRNYSVSM